MRGSRRGRVAALSLAASLFGCTDHGSTSTPAAGSAPTLAPPQSPLAAGAPASPTATATVPLPPPPSYTSADEIARVDPRDPAVRPRLRATALDPSLSAVLRWSALHALEISPASRKDALHVALGLAFLSGADADQRFLATNAVGVLTRLDTPEARGALAQLSSSDSPTAADTATALALKAKER